MRGMNLPFDKTNPRSVRGARRRGWHAVTVPDNFAEKLGLSFLGLLLDADRQCKGYYVYSYLPKPCFAFENIDDAAFFTLKWS